MKTTDKPTIQKFHVEGVKHILPEDAWEAIKIDEAVLIDVREKYETLSYIENSRFHPMWQIQKWLPEIPDDRHLIFICNKGIRSAHVARFLTEHGHPYAFNLDGGFEAWKTKGLPYKTGFRRQQV